MLGFHLWSHGLKTEQKKYLSTSNSLEDENWNGHYHQNVATRNMYIGVGHILIYHISATISDKTREILCYLHQHCFMIV